MTFAVWHTGFSSQTPISWRALFLTGHAPRPRPSMSATRWTWAFLQVRSARALNVKKGGSASQVKRSLHRPDAGRSLREKGPPVLLTNCQGPQRIIRPSRCCRVPQVQKGRKEPMQDDYGHVLCSRLCHGGLQEQHVSWLQGLLGTRISCCSNRRLRKGDNK